MKRQTLEKANQLLKRIEKLENNYINYTSTADQGEPKFEDEEYPHRRQIEMPLNIEDAIRFSKYCERFQRNLLKKLQSEFDSLK